MLYELAEYLGKRIHALTLQLTGHEHDRFLACLFSSAITLTCDSLSLCVTCLAGVEMNVNNSFSVWRL